MRMTRAAVDAIVAHAREALPDECCGLLIGNDDLISDAHRARNLRPGPTRFLIDPHDHFAAIRAARGSGRSVVGVYHSHPRGPATPSPTDLAEASYGEYVYLVVAIDADPPDIRLFRLDAGNFTETPFVTER